MKRDPRYQDGSGLLGVLAIVTLMFLSVAGGMWYEHRVMKKQIDYVLEQRERDLKRLQAVASDMEKVQNERLENKLISNNEAPETIKYYNGYYTAEYIQAHPELTNGNNGEQVFVNDIKDCNGDNYVCDSVIPPRCHCQKRLTNGKDSQ